MNIKLNPNETNPIVLWAEIARLNNEAQSPYGYASWKDAALDERMRRVKAEKALEALTHSDNLAVDAFASEMKLKLYQARVKGRSGWEKCSHEELMLMLREHVEKGDPRDVANFCMFLWSLGYKIE